jgi:hypothetical protein
MRPRLFKHPNGYWYVETERNKRTSLQTRDDSIAIDLFKTIKEKIAAQQKPEIEKIILQDCLAPEDIEVEPNIFSLCGYVYFMQKEDGGPIKIGYSANPNLRMPDIKSKSKANLKIIAVAKGCDRIEKLLHRRFASYRKHGEWFSSNPELIEIIREIKNKS